MITLEGWVMIKHLHKEGVAKAREEADAALDKYGIKLKRVETKRDLQKTG